jgi:hypothetical protein
LKRPPEIAINLFQLAILLNEKLKQDYHYLLDQGVFCSQCGGIAQNGIVVTEIFLTSLNDIFVRGTCKICNGKVACTMEFGEDPIFYEKANSFRKAIGG